MATVTKIQPLTDRERARLMAEVRRLGGECRAEATLGVPRHTIVRALARLPLRAGTVLMIRNALGPASAELPGAA